MKNPEINIVKKLSPEQKKLLFFMPIAIIILVICGYVLFYDGSQNNPHNNTNATNAWDLPSDKKPDMPESPLAIEDQLNAFDRNQNQNNRDFFNALETGISPEKNSTTSTEENLNARDAMYLQVQQQLLDLEQKKQMGNQRNTAPTRTIVPETTSAVSLAEKNIKNEENLTKIENTPNSKTQEDLLRERRDRLLGNNQTSSFKASAFIYGTQKVKAGQTVIIRLGEQMMIQGKKIPRNTLITGTVSFSNYRANISIQSIKTKNEILFLNIDVLGLDGIKGLPINSDNILETRSAIADEELDGVTAQQKATSLLYRLFKSRDPEINLINNHEFYLIHQ